MADKSRETVARIIPRNGAYLIRFYGPGAEHMTDTELFDAASSISTAKRVCREAMSRWDGVSGLFGWNKHDGCWELEATVTHGGDDNRGG